MIETYQPSQSVSATGLVVALAAGLVAAVAGSWLYQLLVDVIPLIYVEFLVTIGFGLGVGFVVGRVARAAKGRGALAVGAVAVACILAGDVASFRWAYDRFTKDSLSDYNSARRDNGLPEATLDEFRGQFGMSRYLEARTEIGWHIGHLGSGGIPITGAFVYLAWAVEAGILGWFAFKTARPHVDFPFCETCGRWTAPSVLGTVPRVSTVALGEAVDAADLAGILAPQHAEGSQKTAVYTANECPGCDAAYLTVTLVWGEKDSKGKLKTTTRDAIRDVVLTKASRQALLTHLSALKPAAKPAAPKAARPPPPDAPA